MENKHLLTKQQLALHIYYSYTPNRQISVQNSCSRTAEASNNLRETLERVAGIVQQSFSKKLPMKAMQV